MTTEDSEKKEWFGIRPVAGGKKMRRRSSMQAEVGRKIDETVLNSAKQPVFIICFQGNR